ncbi:MAG: hypothetical protein AAFQ90_09565 [Pseudomonadota bacterium]
MTEAVDVVTTRRWCERFPSDAEMHLDRIECGLRLIALVEADPSAAQLRLITYITDRMTEDARNLRAALS